MQSILSLIGCCSTNSCKGQQQQYIDLTHSGTNYQPQNYHSIDTDTHHPSHQSSNIKNGRTNNIQPGRARFNRQGSKEVNCFAKVKQPSKVSLTRYNRYLPPSQAHTKIQTKQGYYSPKITFIYTSPTKTVQPMANHNFGISQKTTNFPQLFHRKDSWSLLTSSYSNAKESFSSATTTAFCSKDISQKCLQNNKQNRRGIMNGNNNIFCMNKKIVEIDEERTVNKRQSRLMFTGIDEMMEYTRKSIEIQQQEQKQESYHFASKKSTKKSILLVSDDLAQEISVGELNHRDDAEQSMSLSEIGSSKVINNKVSCQRSKRRQLTSIREHKVQIARFKTIESIKSQSDQEQASYLDLKFMEGIQGKHKISKLH